MKDYSDIAEAEARIAKHFFAYREYCLAKRAAEGMDPDAIPYSASLYKLRDDISGLRFAYDEARKDELQRKYNSRKTLVLELASHGLTEEEIQDISKYDVYEIRQMLRESNHC